MGRRLMTAAQMEAFERRWKTVVFVSGVALVVDLACLAARIPPGLARFACWLIAMVSVLVCGYALAKLHSSPARKATGTSNGYPTDFDPTDIVSTLTDLADPD